MPIQFAFDPRNGARSLARPPPVDIKSGLCNDDRDRPFYSKESTAAKFVLQGLFLHLREGQLVEGPSYDDVGFFYDSLHENEIETSFSYFFHFYKTTFFAAKVFFFSPSRSKFPSSSFPSSNTDSSQSDGPMPGNCG